MKKVVGGLFLSLLAMQVYADRGRIQDPVPVEYQKECGSCHVAFPAWGLDAQSWKQMMTQLDRHYGSDASLSEPLRSKIANYLQAQSVKGKSRSAIPDKDLRMTQTAWFKKEHRKVRATEWNSVKVKTASNCVACHQGAASGLYDDED